MRSMNAVQQMVVHSHKWFITAVIWRVGCDAKLTIKRWRVSLLAVPYCYVMTVDKPFVPNSTTRGHRLRTCCTTPPTDKLTTILQLVVQQICHIAIPEPNISTCQDVGMWQIFVRWWWICCTSTSCRIVMSSSVVGVVQHVRSRCPCSGVW